MSTAQTRETVLLGEPRFSKRVGLLAGGGRFPLHFARTARRRGIEVVCVAVRDHADREIEDAVDRVHWAGLAALGRMIRCFRRENVDCVVMAGKIHKRVMFDPWRAIRLLPDLRGARAWLSRRRQDNQDDSLLLAVIDEFRKDGIQFASALEICPELLVRPGVLTRRRPTPREERDIAFGWRLAKEMAGLDVGQSVAVKEAAVLAVEAIEGTDQAIERAGRLCPAGGFVVVKVAKPQQDMRFDVPTVGCQTVETMQRAGASVLAIEAGRTIVMDLEEVASIADRHHIAIVALESPPSADGAKISGAQE